MLVQVVFLFMFSSYVLSKDIPSYVHLCRSKDPDLGQCFINTLNEMMPNLIKGIPEMDIPSIDPLAVTSVKVNTGNSGPTSFDIELFNVTVYGLKDMEVKSLVVDLDKVLWNAVIHLPRVTFEATYKIKGKILLFELNGEGHFSFNSTDVTTDGVWQGKLYTKKNKEHIVFDHIEFSNVTLNNISVWMTNLFAENEVLTETVNKAMNDNIDTLRGELEPIIRETLAEIIRDFFNRVYRLFPRDQLYLVD